MWVSILLSVEIAIEIEAADRRRDEIEIVVASRYGRFAHGFQPRSHGCVKGA